METRRDLILGPGGTPMPGTQALLWGNNASWICIKCNRLQGNRTGDTEHVVVCCGVAYEILRGRNKNGDLHLGSALGVRIQ